MGSSGCAACLGGPSDTFGRLQGTEVCISTTNRNFPADGEQKRRRVLGQPIDGAASALTGYITDRASMSRRRLRRGWPG